MRAFRVQRQSDNTDFYTSDFIDLWNTLDEGADGDPITVTAVEMNAVDFFEKVKQNVNGPEDHGQLSIIN